MQANAVVLQHLKLHSVWYISIVVIGQLVWENGQNWMGTATTLSFIRIGSYFINLNFFCSIFHKWKTHFQLKSLLILSAEMEM